MSRYKYLTLADRIKLDHLYSNGDRSQDIAEALDMLIYSLLDDE